MSSSPTVAPEAVRETVRAPEAVAVPVMGRIAAGTPIEAIQQERDRLPVPENLLGAGEHFVLEIGAL